VKVDTCPETGICKDWMKGKVIGVQISTAHANYAKKAFGDVAEVRTYDKQDNVNADLVAGRVDIVLADAVAMDYFLKTDEGKDFEKKGSRRMIRSTARGWGPASERKTPR
jgi:ABC-type amino acid transport substrate-binding protein